MKFTFLLIGILFLSSNVYPQSYIEVPSMSYQELHPLLNQKGNKTYVVNFWATWCAPCIKELPYFEELNNNKNIEVILVSLDFPKHKEKRLLPFIKKRQLSSRVILLDDDDENFWINDISSTWSGALPATLIYTQNRRGFYEQSFTKEELFQEVKSYF
ncbi:MAG: TlpA disulfide reductase family protein [Flavobacteriaceae bacterium]|jgi:thiol-disulfide isomerase/thioredoxin|nr:TlpA disulfide reductase family protein [Flavobacteriaceae bacterium]